VGDKEKKNMERFTIDFETRSAADLTKTGAWRYAEDETTELMCLAVLRPDGTSFLWHPDYPSVGIIETNRGLLEEFFEAIRDGAILEAHNVGFERALWEKHCVPKLGWPSVQPEQWRCSMALASMHALPRSLGAAAEALGLDVRKDEKGARIMKKISRPRLPLKADLELIAAHLFGSRDEWKDVAKPKNMYELKRLYRNVPAVSALNVWHEKVDELELLFQYCLRDVETEHALSERLGGDLGVEHEVWAMDQEMNARGVTIDTDLARQAISMAEQCADEANDEMARLTDGHVTSITQREALLNWINGLGEGVLPDTQRPTLEAAVQDPSWGETARQALQVRLYQAKSSVKKYPAMLKTVGADGRTRGLLQYHGADTGRWAGRLIQPQNMPRGSVNADIEDLCGLILDGDRDMIELLYGSTMEVLSSALRGAIMAAPGYDLICSDYSSIEARGTFWIADDKAALEIFRQGKDIYKQMAVDIYGIPYEEVTKDQRQMGKQAILGLGYQMGAAKFADTCQGYGIDIDEDFAKRVVNTYRSSHQAVKQFWYGIERAAQEAASPGSPGVTFGRLRLFVEDDFLKIRLPSGRCLHYYEPRVQRIISKWQDDDKQEMYATALREGWSVQKAEWEGLKVKTQLTFMGLNSQTRKFSRQETYGGKLTENVVQAVSRDVMVSALLEIYKHGKYMPLLTVHDEVIAEVPEGQGSVEEFEEMLSRVPDWADGFPVAAADGWIGKRYRK